MMDNHFKIARVIDECITLLDDEDEQSESFRPNQRHRKSGELTLVKSMAHHLRKRQPTNALSINYSLANFNLDEIEEGLEEFEC